LLRRLLTSREFMAGLLLVVAFAAAAVFAPQLAPPQSDDPYDIPRDGFKTSPSPPSPKHLLGTLEDQRDVLYGLVWGTRVAFRVGFLVTLARALLGITIGALSGYYRGWFDAVMMRLTDAFMAFPIIVAALVMLTVLSNPWIVDYPVPEEIVIPAALVLFGWMQYARLARGNVMAELDREYVKAAISVGARGRRILLRHVLPNAAQGLFELMASDIGVMVVTAAVLTFLSLTRAEPKADWGVMLKLSRNWIVSGPNRAFEYWFCYGPPIVAVLLFSTGWSLIGDGLRRVLDPRSRGSKVSSASHQARHAAPKAQA
jgi:peptide/nickel transport system permease protein